MPRRKYQRREVKPDLIYQSIEVTKLINYVMRDGKKKVAEKIVYGVFEDLKKQKLDPIEVLKTVIKNVAPSAEVRPRRIGGASYLVPMETSTRRKIFLALNWLIQAALARSSKEYHTFREKLLAEMLAAYRGEGEAINKKKQVEKLAEANKAFAHFRW